MEYLDSVWQISIIALIAGAMIGALAYRLLAPAVKHADKVKTELGVAKEELNSYKTDVNQHFNKTSELVNDLTQNYVKVYQHLAQGAQTLGDNKAFTSLLAQHQGKLSISVDDETTVADKLADDLLIDPAVKLAGSVGSIDEPTEPLPEVNAAQTGPVSAESGDTKSKASGSSGNLGDSTGIEEPVINVEVLDKATENVEIEVNPKTEVGSISSEGEEKIKVTTTAH